jgi:hypothetical protein
MVIFILIVLIILLLVTPRGRGLEGLAWLSLAVLVGLWLFGL